VKLGMPPNVNPQDELTMSQTRDMTLLDSAGHALFRRSMSQTLNGRNWELIVTFAQEGAAIGRAESVAGRTGETCVGLARRNQGSTNAVRADEYPVVPVKRSSLGKEESCIVRACC